MAFNATAIFEANPSASDTYGGGFDPAATMPNIFGVSSGANTATVVVTCGEQPAAGDVGNWFFLQSGTNGKPGWYKITAVGTLSFTINAAAGAWVQYSSTDGTVNMTPGTTDGCGTTSALSGITGAIDYSQSTTAFAALTDLVIMATNTRLQSATKPANANNRFAGNFINVTGGAGFTVQRVYISSVNVASNYYQCDKACGTAGSTAGTGNMGGAFASPGLASSIITVAGMTLYMTGTFSQSSASANGSNGQFSSSAGTMTTPLRIEGYSTVRGDNGRATVTQTSNTYTVITTSSAIIQNIQFGATGTSGGFAIQMTQNNHSIVVRNCLFRDIQMVVTNSATLVTVTLANCNASGIAIGIQAIGSGAVNVHDCEIKGATGSSATLIDVACHLTVTGSILSATATTGKCINVQSTNQSVRVDGCTFYGGTNSTTTSGVIFTVGTESGFEIRNSIFQGFGSSAGAINKTTGNQGGIVENCAFYNNTVDIGMGTKVVLINKISLSGSPFTNAGSGDFSLNNTAGAGALCRAVATYSFLSTSSYRDIGAAQSQAAAAGVATNPLAGFIA